MTTLIVYPNDENEGGFTILNPNLACGLTLDQIAEKDVPKGKPYLFIDSSQIPMEYREFRNAWELDFSGAKVNGEQQ